MITALSTINVQHVKLHLGINKKNNNTSFSNNFSNIHNTKDLFVRSKKISFGNSAYNRQEAESFIDDIINNKVSTNKRGFQGEFYRLGKNLGIKAINPLDKTSQYADLQGINNAREYYILNVIQNINPEIATKPVDLIKKDNKYFLVTEFVEGKHPFDSGINKKQIQDILKKSFQLDINGIAHSDLQSSNIFLLNSEKAKFIDFGAYQLLLNKGFYVSSDCILENEILNSYVKDLHNSPLESKFLATFYDNEPKSHLISYSDNPHLKIKSNAANFEYRMIYDFLYKNKSENPKEFFADYLKIKAENYHKPMAEFLEKLKISPSDSSQISQRDMAVKTEKLFAEIFSNPSENILKSELEKIQLKWLLNDYQGGRTKAFDYFNKYLENIEKYSSQSVENEKQYFDTMIKLLEPYKNELDNQEFKGKVLDDNENLLNKIFKNVETAVNSEEPVVIEETFHQPKTTKSNNKVVKVLLAVAAVAAAIGLWIYNKSRKAN